MIRFDGQVAIVTGSGRGLGAAYARLLAERGASVIVHDAGVALDGTGFDPNVANAVVSEITTTGGSALPCYENIESQRGCQRLIETAISQFGRLDILINNAGWITFTPLEEMTPALLERIINIQIAAPFWLSQAAFPTMKQQHYGRIIFTTSGRAMFLEHALPELTGYALGKMAQLGLVNALAVAGMADGIRVNAISPVAATRMLQRAVAPQELRPEQVAPGVAFLASAQCNVSGIVLQASNSHFATAQWKVSAGIDAGEAVITPEAIDDQWSFITGV
ncbi:MAG TPA: SDR family NAD(P)-dependent oxidoreductase [Ktedonobacteraceae bacterium]|nr:SDR family NAD(P)-dependent oxidoreductase [Ktedonobacteraceae bacterium]